MTVARSPEAVWSAVDVADSTASQVGAKTYRCEGSCTLGKLAGSRTVVAGESPSEVVFTYQIDITPSGMAERRGGIRIAERSPASH